MAFNRQNLSRISGANTNSASQWAYASSEDNLAAMQAADYFLDATVEMGVGDTIILSDQTAATPVNGISFVDANDGLTLTTAVLV